MQKITPNLWFNRNAQEAVQFYLSVFKDSEIKSTTHYPKEGLADFQKEFAGEVLTIEFEVRGLTFVAINAGNDFTPNPSISFFINFDPSHDKDARKHMDEVWEKLSENGKVLMPLDAYPFSERYGWIQDKYGISWQLIYTKPEGEDRPLIIPSLLFVTDTGDKAEEATNYYLSLFKNTKRGAMLRYPAGMGNNKEGAIMFTDFMLENQWFAAMDASSKDHAFAFNEAISLSITCEDQAEIDYYWNALTKNGGQESVCGWLKDKFGLSWQVAPEGIDALVQNPKAFANMMKMKKIIIKDLEKLRQKIN